MLVKIYDKHFIACIAGLHERTRFGNNVTMLGTHAAATVNYQTDGDGNILVTEMLDPLSDAVFKYLKVRLV
jgi:hypothetical protein